MLISYCRPMTRKYCRNRLSVLSVSFYTLTLAHAGPEVSHDKSAFVASATFNPDMRIIILIKRNNEITLR